MLVVIAIIGVLAGLLFPIAGKVHATRARKAAQAEMEQVATAIEEYKSKLGYYPPDNPLTNANGSINYGANQLYYELVGTIQTNGSYQTVNGATTLSSPSAAFGQNVGTFLNSTKTQGSDDVRGAVNFMKHIKAGQFLLATNLTASATVPAMVLGTTLPGPFMYGDISGHTINPWFYNSSSPSNNPSSYDLWTYLVIGHHTNVVCNWSAKPLVY